MPLPLGAGCKGCAGCGAPPATGPLNASAQKTAACFWQAGDRCCRQASMHRCSHASRASQLCSAQVAGSRQVGEVGVGGRSRCGTTRPGAALTVSALPVQLAACRGCAALLLTLPVLHQPGARPSRRSSGGGEHWRAACRLHAAL